MMNSKELNECLKHIQLGIEDVFYYNYEGSPLPLRPISSYELDKCFYEALRFATQRVANLVVKLRLKLIKGEDELDEELSPEDYVSLQKHYDAISYLMVYYSMKDFQNEEFSKPIVEDGEIQPKGIFVIKKMRNIHRIATIVINASYQPKEIIKEIISDENGRVVAYSVFYLNIPLAQYNKITRLQRDYLLYTKGEITKLTQFKVDDKTNERKKKQYIISGEKMTMADIIAKFYGRDILENFEKEEDKNDPFSHIKIEDVLEKIKKR